MNSSKSPVSALIVATLFGTVLGSVSCRKPKEALAVESGLPVVIAPELLQNEMGSLSGAVYRSQVGSQIHWQPWTKISLDRAKAAQRLVFCVVAMPQQPDFQEVLKLMEQDAEVVGVINSNYVPILIDGDASREISILTADLCAEIKRPLQLPLFVWMTYEGNPVAWIPVTSTEGTRVSDLFTQSHTMVSQMWQEDLKVMAKDRKPSYMLKNSAQDNANRRNRLQERKVGKVMSEQPALDAVRSLRQLASLYDPYSRSFDESGGLLPASSIELLATAAVRPGLPADVRARCKETTRDLLVDLLPSAMFDPLDGGVFSSRRSISWALPAFVRDCPGQARVAVALIDAHRATGNARALEKALDLISFVEKNYGTSEGLFAVGLMAQSSPEKWMWSVEEIEKVLGAEDAAWWIKATEMKGLGNLPSEVDPRREFFRSNTIGLSKSIAEIAADLGQSLEAFRPRFEAVRAKLLAVRNARLGDSPRDDSSHAGATFRMVSAYVAAYCVTGDEKFREKAVSLMKRARSAFAIGPRLRVFSNDSPDSIGAGRAFLYALALQSVLDVSAITSEEEWLLWAEDLATTAAEMFTGNGFLRECPEDAKIIDLPVTDLVMLFDDSTAGLVSAAESRLAEIGRPLVLSFSELATPLPTYAIDRPILHTDLLLATLYRHYPMTLALGNNLSPALRSAVERLPSRSIQRRPARADEQVPDGSIKILLTGAESPVVSDPADLQQALLPSP